MSIRFSILITTRNRSSELMYSLSRLSPLLSRNDVECIICDDGSTDNTVQQLEQFYPKISLIRHSKSIGLIGSRNELLSRASGNFAISLDDDAHFLTTDPLEEIEKVFQQHRDCGVISFRIFWSKTDPVNTETTEKPERVRGFVGCGHAWNMEAWRSIPEYPAWFIFYGEEDFASYHLLKKKWWIIYDPNILVHHRVNVTERKTHSDYRIRLRRSLRAGWFLMFLFFPWKKIPRRWAYSIKTQIAKRTLRGDVQGTIAIVQALADLVLFMPRLLHHKSTLTRSEFEQYNQLKDTPVYWNSIQDI